MSATNRTIPGVSVLAGAIVIWFLAVPQPAEAQKAVPRSGGDQQLVKAPSDGAATKAPSGGDETASGGGQATSGGGQSGSDAPKTAAVQRRPTSDGGSRRAGRTAAPRDAGKSEDSGKTLVTTPTGSGGTATPPYSRPRGDNAQTGQAVERRGRLPVTGGGTTVWVPGGYYGGYYPWGYGGMGLGGYYGGYYDPWYYGDSQPYSPYAGGNGYDGQLRLKVKPREAEVYVDGYYAGLVDEFDGVFQRLQIEPGPHRIEVRADGYETLVIDLRIQPDRTITYTGELKERPS
jgi:hypothetical protein